MKPDDTREKNEKIIKFLGYELVNDAPKEFPNGYYAQIDGGDWYAIEELCFHNSWDELLGVVRRIDNLYHEAFPTNEKFIEMTLNHERPIDEHYINVVALPMATPILEVFEAVVKFIDWFNEQKKA